MEGVSQVCRSCRSFDFDSGSESRSGSFVDVSSASAAKSLCYIMSQEPSLVLIYTIKWADSFQMINTVKEI